MNLIVHREYSFSTSTFISLYEDRLEFTSIGGLVSGVTLKDVENALGIGQTTCGRLLRKMKNTHYRLWE